MQAAVAAGPFVPSPRTDGYVARMGGSFIGPSYAETMKDIRSGVSDNVVPDFSRGGE
jgi:hypothetical protein